MSQQQLSKLWTAISTALLYYVINTWLVTQGGEQILDIKLVLGDRVPAAMIVLFVCTVLLTITSLIGRLYAQRSGPKWHERIPIVGFDSLITNQPEARLFQITIMVIFSLLPAISLIHFWCVCGSGHIVTTGHPPHSSGFWDMSAIGVVNPAKICTTLKTAGVCDNGATFFPVLEPLVLIILTIIAAWTVVAHWRKVFQ